MEAMVQILEPLSEQARLRLVRWAADYVGLHEPPAPAAPATDPEFELGSFEELAAAAEENTRRATLETRAADEDDRRQPDGPQGAPRNARVEAWLAVAG